MVKVRVPATSANVGPGFDCLGIAYNIYNELSFDLKGKTLKITDCDKKFANAENPAVRAFYETLKYKKIEKPEGLVVKIKGDIPISRGLGSSAALTTAGVMAADKLYKLHLKKDEMLYVASLVEGHPDNAAPCIYGGLTAAVIDGEKSKVAQYKVSKKLRFFVLIPSFEVSTAAARTILPKEYSRADAVFTMSRLAILLKALESGNEELLSSALDDKIHQPYRKTLIPKYDEIQQLTKDSGATGMVISGSGSTLLVVGGNDNTLSLVQKGLKKLYKDVCVNGQKVQWKVKEVSVETKGSVIMEDEYAYNKYAFNSWSHSRWYC